MTAPISALVSVCPRILARTASRLSGGAADRHQAGDRLGETAERGLGEADLVRRHQRIIVGDEQRRQQHL